jgi:hypothetical protein
MRGRIAGAILIGAVSAAAAHAADISPGLGISGNLYSPLVARIEPVIVFDFEPGVIVRTYSPWRNRHYFPRTGKRPKIGRREILPKHRMSKPEEYFRYWSASSFPDSPGRYAMPPASVSEQQ